MEIRIECSCGTPYTFDVEPEEGRMPTPVQCPTCGVDGTEAANEYIRQFQAPAPAQPAVAVRRVAATAPASAAAPAVAPPPSPGPKRAYGQPNLALGSLGAIGGAVVAMLIWFFIIKLTNTEIGIIAWGVGIVIGVACRTLGGGYSQTLGIIAGACAFVAIVGGEYLATKSAFDEFVDGFVDTAYDSQVARAQRVVAVANDDNALRSLLAEEAAEDDFATEPVEVTDTDLAAFRQDELPELQALAGGSPSKAEFERDFRTEMNSAEMKAFVLRQSVSLWTLLWLFLGVGSAYKLGTGQTE